MSSSAEILQEYLVKVGFQTDAISYRKFEDSIGVVGKRILGVGVAVGGVVAGVEAAAAAFAYSMRKVYFEAELSGSSVKGLKSLAFAGKQIGISAESMGSAVHNLATKFRTDPGVAAFVRSLGIKVEGRDVSDVVVDAVEALNKLPEFQATAMASQILGIDPDSYHLMRTHFAQFKQLSKEAKELYKQMGFDPDDPKNKKAIEEYTLGLDLLSAKFSILSKTVLVEAVPTFSAINANLMSAVDWWTDFAKSTDKAAFSIKALKAAGDGLISGDFYKFLFGGDEKNKISMAARISAAFVTGNWKEVNRLSGIVFPGAEPESGYSNEVSGKIKGLPGSPKAGTSGGKKLNRNERNNNPGNIEYGPFAIQHGAIGSDGRFAIFPDMATGKATSEALLQVYGRSGRNTVSKIINSWAPKKDNNDTDAYIASVSKRLGVSSNQPLDLENPAIRQAVSSAIGIHEGMGSGGSTINQTTNITVHGAGDPNATAKAIGKEQSRINGDLLRNKKSAHG